VNDEECQFALAPLLRSIMELGLGILLFLIFVKELEDKNELGESGL